MAQTKVKAAAERAPLFRQGISVAQALINWGRTLEKYSKIPQAEKEEMQEFEEVYASEVSRGHVDMLVTNSEDVKEILGENVLVKGEERVDVKLGDILEAPSKVTRRKVAHAAC